MSETILKNCEVCGQKVELHLGTEGTNSYIPREAEDYKAALNICVQALSKMKGVEILMAVKDRPERSPLSLAGNGHHEPPATTRMLTPARTALEQLKAMGFTV